MSGLAGGRGQVETGEPAADHPERGLAGSCKGGPAAAGGPALPRHSLMTPPRPPQEVLMSRNLQLLSATTCPQRREILAAEGCHPTAHQCDLLLQTPLPSHKYTYIRRSFWRDENATKRKITF